MSSKLAALLPLLLLPGLAHADDAKDQQDALATLAHVGTHTGLFEANQYDQGAYLDVEPAACTAAIATLERLGVPKTQMIHARDAFPLKSAPSVCARYAKAHAMKPALQPLRDGFNAVGGLVHIDPKDPYGAGSAREAARRGTVCVEAIDAALAKGADPDVVIATYREPLTLTTGRAMCAKLVTDASALAGQGDTANADRTKAARAKYTKHGAAGDKLEWLLYYDPDGAGKTWYLAPRCEATDDPKRLAKAKVLISWGVNDDGSQVLRKLTFKGNKKVKDQERTFATEAKAYSFCK